MKEIKLPNGSITLIDDEDAELINGYKWYSRKGRHTSYCFNDNTSMHRLIMGLLKGDKRTIDHINGDGLDNRKENLRICTRMQNSYNRKINDNSKSGYKGVSWDKKNQKWTTCIKANGKRFNIGLFDDSRIAALAYNDKAVKLHGEYAKLNKVEFKNDVKTALSYEIDTRNKYGFLGIVSKSNSMRYIGLVYINNTKYETKTRKTAIAAAIDRNNIILENNFDSVLSFIDKTNIPQIDLPAYDRMSDEEAILRCMKAVRRSNTSGFSNVNWNNKMKVWNVWDGKKIVGHSRNKLKAAQMFYDLKNNGN